MEELAFRDRVLQAMEEQKIKKMELHRRSGVSYHALDKFLKRDGATTSAENATKIAQALGISVEETDDYEELRSIYYQLSEEKKKFALMSLKGLLDQKA